MSPDNRFDLGDYVEVKDRIAILYERFPQARIETSYDLTSEPDDKPKVICRAFVYRQPDDPLPAGHGTSWLYLPGSTPYTRGSEVENAETSAVGRAIGMLGILIDRSIASAQEVQNKADEPASRPAKREQMTNGDGGLIGVAEIGVKGQTDFELRQTPEGFGLAFRLRGEKGGIKVIVKDPIATLLFDLRDEVIGQRVTCWGAISDETFTANKGKPNEHKVTYQVLTLSKIKTPTFTLPATDAVSDAPGLSAEEALRLKLGDRGPDGPDEPEEAESVPAFDDAELAAIDAAIDKAVA